MNQPPIHVITLAATGNSKIAFNDNVINAVVEVEIETVMDILLGFNDKTIIQHYVDELQVLEVKDSNYFTTKKTTLRGQVFCNQLN